jgi:hypothetical protein
VPSSLISFHHLNLSLKTHTYNQIQQPNKQPSANILYGPKVKRKHQNDYYKAHDEVREKCTEYVASDCEGFEKEMEDYTFVIFFLHVG